MKPIVLKSTLKPRQAALYAFAFLIAAAALPSFASTASNTTITNTATVAFSDAGGVPQTAVTATATVTVTLVPSALNISSPPNVPNLPQGTAADLVYTIIGTANGPDTYSLSAADTVNNLTGTGITFPGGNPITLSATTLAANAPIGANTITVPYDGNASTATINGLVPGATIMIGGNPYVIAAAGINKTGSVASNTVVITLVTPIAGTAGVAGAVVPERLLVHVNVPSGTVTTGTSGTQIITLSGTSTTDPTKTGTQGTPTTVTTIRPTLTVTKQVSTDNGATFTAAGNATPGTSLIYKITASNTGATAATQVQFTDVVPLFLTYVPGSARFAQAASTYAAATALTEGSGGYTFTPATQTANYNPGGAIGTVAATTGVLIFFFRATIN